MPHSNQNETYDVKRSIYIDLDVKIFTSIPNLKLVIM